MLDANEEQPLQSPAQVELHWIYRGQAQPGCQLVAAVRAAQLPQGSGKAWVACEAVAMRAIRKHLLEDRLMERAALNPQGYWKLGMANHPDHDMGEDG